MRRSTLWQVCKMASHVPRHTPTSPMTSLAAVVELGLEGGVDRFSEGVVITIAPGPLKGRFSMGRPVQRMLQDTDRIQHRPLSGETSQNGNQPVLLTHITANKDTLTKQRRPRSLCCPTVRSVTTTASDSPPAPAQLPGATPSYRHHWF